MQYTLAAMARSAVPCRALGANAPCNLDAPKHVVERVPSHHEALHSMDNQPRNKPDLLRCHGPTANAVDHHGALAAVSEVNVAEHDPQRPRFCERKLDQLMGPRLERLLTLLGCMGLGLLA